MDKHLNIFRPFQRPTAGASGDEDRLIEKNITRALGLCLRHNPVLLVEFIRAVLEPSDAEAVLQSLDGLGARDSWLDIEVDTDRVGSGADHRAVYGVALTAGRALDCSAEAMKGFGRLARKKEYADMALHLGDVLVLVECKRTSEDCRNQLWSQVERVKRAAGEEIEHTHYVGLSWSSILRLMERTKRIQDATGGVEPFVDDFLGMVTSSYPEWSDSSPLGGIPFDSDRNSSHGVRLRRRLGQLCRAVAEWDGGRSDVPYRNRLGLVPRVACASEVLIDFERRDTEQSAVFRVWPGNTKGQGCKLPNSDDWTRSRELIVGDRSYPMEVVRDVSFRHATRWISHCTFGLEHQTESLEMCDSGRKRRGREDWRELQELLDRSIADEVDWRSLSDFQRKFIHTNRNELAVAFGYQVSVFIPFDEFSRRDRSSIPCEEVKTFMRDVVRSLEQLLS